MTFLRLASTNSLPVIMTREANRIEIKVTELFSNHRMLQCFSCVSDQSVAKVNQANQVKFSQNSEDHLLISRGYMDAAGRTPSSNCVEAMSVRYNVEEALERIFSDVPQDNFDLKVEVEDLSKEKDGEMINHLQKKIPLKLKKKLSFQKWLNTIVLCSI